MSIVRYISRPASIALFAGLALFVLIPRGAQAHAARSSLSTNTFFWIIPSRESIDGIYSIAFGDIPAMEIRRGMDRDGDRMISNVELEAFGEQLCQRIARCVTFDINDVNVRADWSWTSPDFEDIGIVPQWLRIDLAFTAPVANETDEIELVLHDECSLLSRGEAEYRIEPALDSTIQQVLPEPTEDQGTLALRFERASNRDIRIRYGPSSDGIVAAGPLPDERGRPELPQPEPNVLASLLRGAEGITLWVLLIAFGLGAFHALSPGHGKTLVAAYLVGEQGSAWQAILLGFVVTLTHVASVVVVGVLVLFASQYFLPESMSRILTIASGLMIATIGVGLLWNRWRERGRSANEGGDEHHSHQPHNHDEGEVHHHHQHPHHDPHDHHDHAEKDYHHHGHSHAPPGVSLWRLLTLGISGGLVPCPSAMVVLLLAIAVGRIAEGMLLIAAFSLGLASVLVAIGIMVVKAGRLLDRVLPGRRTLACLPLLSAFVVTGLGLTITIEGLLQP